MARVLGIGVAERIPRGPVIHKLAASRVSSCRSRRALTLRPSRAREERSGVDRIAAPPPPVARAHHHLEVQMRLAPMSVPSRADVYREPTLAVPLQSEHTPVVSGQDRCSAWCGDVDGAVDTGSAAQGSKVVGYLIWRHARDGHHELPRAERTVEGRLASWERAPRDLKCNERQRALSAPSPVHLTAAFAIASVRVPRRFGYHSHFASAGGVGFAGGTSISGGSRSPFLNSCIPFPRLPIISGNRPGPKTSRTTTRTTTNSPMPMPNIDGDHRSASHQPQRLVILWPDRLRQDTAPSTEPSTPLTARRLLQRRQTLLPGPPAEVEVDRIPELRARPRAAPPSRRVQSRSPPVAVSSRPATNLSTRSSIAARSSAVAQPLASTLANATAKRALAPARHVDVTAFPCVSAFSWHRSFAAAFLPAAFSSAAAHFSARVAAASTARTPASRPKATPTTPRSIRFIAPPLRASSRASDTTTSASQQRNAVLPRLVLGGLALAS